MLVIENDYLKVTYNLKGAELESIYDKIAQKELLYEIDDRSWHHKDVIIFPFVARLKNGEYDHFGKTYKLLIHGLARYMSFSVVKHENSLLILEINSTEETLERYPFHFNFKVKYELIDNKLITKFIVNNKDTAKMFFSVGAHPALALPATEKDNETDISGNRIIFEKEEDLVHYKLDKAGEFIVSKEHFGKMKEIELTKELFNEYRTLIFEKPLSNYIILKKKDGSSIKIDIHEAKILALWTHDTYGAYICVEPWCGLPDYVDTVRELKDKDHILKLKPKDHFEFTYSIEVSRNV